MTIANAAQQGKTDCVYTVEITLTCKGKGGPESITVKVAGDKLDTAIATAKAKLQAGESGGGGVSPQGSGGGGSR